MTPPNWIKEEAEKYAKKRVECTDCDVRDWAHEIASYAFQSGARAWMEMILNYCVFQSDWYMIRGDFSKSVACDSIAAHIRAFKEP